MKVLSLFDGISIAQQALKNLNIPVEVYYASEIDKYAIQITRKNFPNTIQLGDVRNVKAEDLPQIDLLIGGSPCQDLSIANKNRQGLSGARSGLFWEYVRILKEVKPKYFVLENVASMPKEAKELITETLGVEPIMINAALVSAQNRKRLFWTNIPNIKLPVDRGILLKDILEENVPDIYNVTDKKIVFIKKYNGESGLSPNNFKGKGYIGSEKSVALTLPSGNNATLIKRLGQLNSGGQGDRIYSTDGKSVNLSANGGGRGAKTGLYLIKGVASRTYPRYKTEGVERTKQIEIRDDEKANAMTSVSGDSMVMANDQIRKLTPIECERLQSLPDNYTEGISNSQRYKALGNGFNCAVIGHILINLLKQCN